MSTFPYVGYVSSYVMLHVISYITTHTIEFDTFCHTPCNVLAPNCLGSSCITSVITPKPISAERKYVPKHSS